MFADHSDDKQSITDFVQATLKQSIVDRSDQTKQKNGKWLGVYAVNPVNNQKVPLYVADYVLMEYGTGVVMAVPAHDERDFEFSTQFNLPKGVVVSSLEENSQITMQETYTAPGFLIESEQFNGLKSEDAKKSITTYLESINKGRVKVQYKLGIG